MVLPSKVKNLISGKAWILLNLFGPLLSPNLVYPFVSVILTEFGESNWANDFCNIRSLPDIKKYPLLIQRVRS